MHIYGVYVLCIFISVAKLGMYVCRQYSSNSKLEPTALYQLHALIKTFRTTHIINVLNFSHMRHHLGLMASMEATWLGWKPSHTIKMFSPISTSFGSHVV